MAHQFYKDIRNVPNLLSLYRIFAIVVSVICFYKFDLPIVGATLGLTAGLTDYADGIYARKHNMCTQLGALLDQVSDLLFNFVVMGAAVARGVWPWEFLALWGMRDLTVLSMRASAAQMGFDIPSIFLGKLASNFIFYALFLMPIDYALNDARYQFHQTVVDNIHPYIGVGVHWISIFGIVTGIILQWITAFVYVKTYIRKYDELHVDKNKVDQPAVSETAETAPEAAEVAPEAVAESSDSVSETTKE